jgi:hypothetical protein
VYSYSNNGHAIAQALICWRYQFDPWSGSVGFVVDKVALGQVSSEYFGFACQFSFHRLLHIPHLSPGAGTVGKIVADVPSGLSLTPPQDIKKNIYCSKNKNTCVVLNTEVHEHVWLRTKLSVLSMPRVATEILTGTDIFLLHFSVISL